MAASTKLSLIASRGLIWVNANPTAARIALMALPIGLALAAAVLGFHPAYACSAASSGSGSCGG